MLSSQPTFLYKGKGWMEKNVEDDTQSIMQKRLGIQGINFGKVLLNLFHISK
jgi:hypothetical protein